MPTNIEKYGLGNLYMCARRTRDESSGGEGFEVLANEPFDEGRESGQFTHKVMHFSSRVPKAIKAVIPDKYLHVHERSWNSYPHYRTEYEMPGMGENFYLLIESYHYPYTGPDQVNENAFDLNEAEMKMRKIVWQDIVNGDPQPENPEQDCHNLYIPEAGMPEALQTTTKKQKKNQAPEWSTLYHGEMMICQKCVKFYIKIFAIRKIIEHYLDVGLQKIFLDSHRLLMSWAKEWFPMTLDDVREFERMVQEEVNQNQYQVVDDGRELPAE